MSQKTDMEVYIPKDACVQHVSLQSLPSSVTRKMGVRIHTAQPQRATWICPVELRGKGLSGSGCLTPGNRLLPVVSFNPKASRIFQNLRSADDIPEQKAAPVLCSKVSSYKQNAIVLYNSQIFLSLRKNKMPCAQSNSRSFNLPAPASQTHLAKALPLSSAQGHSPESQKCVRADDSRSAHAETSGSRLDGGMRENTEELRNNGQDGKAEKDGENDEKTVEKEMTCGFNQDGVTVCDAGEDREQRRLGGGDGGAESSRGEAQEQLEVGEDADVLHKFPVISHITSLAEGWSGSAETFWSSSEEPEPKKLKAGHDAPDKDPPNTPRSFTARISGTRSLPPDTSSQRDAPTFFTPPPERRLLDYEALEKEERISRIRNSLRRMQTQMETLNGQR
ncbi:uncharacterized protein si:dkeyp-110g5.4 [Hoplias malabaricus]|uniref:uncharacterized protein si:dkeyp-110g5.4 n=1 Tax=Hoplias malabaricus TaxID=27720 RepID=UPI0034637E69